MVESWFRIVPTTVQVGGKEVVLTYKEEYTSENPGCPIRVGITGPNGLMTQGEPAAAWREMMRLLGIAPPAPPSAQATLHPATSEQDVSEPLPQFHSEPALSEVPLISAEPAHGPKPILAAHKDESFGAVDSHGASPQPVEKGAAETEEDHDEDEEKTNMELEDMQVDDMELDDIEPEDEEPSEDSLNRNILQEALIRRLNRPVYSDDPPREITADVDSEIENASSEREAAAIIGDIEANIRLIEMRDEAAKRAENLQYLQQAGRARRCGHVKSNGKNCGSPAQRHEDYCFFHAQMHADSVEIPVIEDQHSLQVALTRLAQQVAAGKVDPPQAKVLLQILESAGRNLPGETAEA